jgi:hypothetical protein
MQGSMEGGESPLFVLATRLYVHYKFKTRKSFDPSAALIDDDYAKEVLALARAVKDAKLHELAAAFEQARFGGAAPAPTVAKAKPARPAKEEPMLDFPIEEPT